MNMETFQIKAVFSYCNEGILLPADQGILPLTFYIPKQYELKVLTVNSLIIPDGPIPFECSKYLSEYL